MTVSEAVGRGFDSRRARQIPAAPSLACLLATALLLAAPALAETFRCGQSIASPDMTVGELLEKCGEPTTKKVEVLEVRGPNVHGAGNVNRGTTTIETWTYDRGSQSFPMVVTIEDGVIKRMERGE